MPRDIRKGLPQTAQTDVNKFPEYNYQPYPRMMTKIVVDKKAPYYDNSGNPVIVNNATEEAQFKVKHGQAVDADEPPAAETVTINDVAPKHAAPANTLAEKRKPTMRAALPKDLD